MIIWKLGNLHITPHVSNNPLNVITKHFNPLSYTYVDILFFTKGKIFAILENLQLFPLNFLLSKNAEMGLFKSVPSQYHHLKLLLLSCNSTVQKLSENIHHYA